MAKTRKTELDIDLDLKIEEKAKKNPVVEAPPPPEKKGGKKKFNPKFKLLAILSSVFFIIITSVAIYYWPEKKAPEPEKPAEAVVESVTFSKTPQYKFEPFFLPVKTKNTKNVFLKVAFSLELSNELVITEIEQNSAILRANLSFLFNKKSLSDLKSDPDRKKLAREIKNILNRSFQKGTVKKVYFTQFFLK